MMKRKNFIASVLPAALSFPAVAHTIGESASKEFTIPAYLKPGDTIGITSPAGFITQEDIRPAVQKMKAWGYQVRLGNSIGKRDYTFGGTDEERLADLQSMLDDASIHAIMCARGGYGAIRIIDRLDFSRFKKTPKWLIGFSDITVLHCHINSNFHIATLHSKMCNSFPDNQDAAEQVQKDSIENIDRSLKGAALRYTVIPDPKNKNGFATGVLVGGNLKTIETLAGSASDLDTKNKILFVEDTGEYLYSIDRMFWNLQRSGKLEHLKGLIIGGFRIKPDDPDEVFGKTIQDIVLEKIKHYRYPVCFSFPTGHQKDNQPLQCGVVHTLTVSPEAVVLQTGVA